MKNKIIFAETILIILLAIIVAVLARPHTWMGIPTARVEYGGASIETSQVYRSHEGNILIDMKVPEEEVQYIYYPSRRLIGIPNRNQFIYVPFFAFSKEVPPPVVMSDDRIKVEEDMNLYVLESGIEFTTLRGVRTRVLFQD